MEKFDVVIIGGGPAGLTASVYASRSELKTVFIEKGAPGGKMVSTHLIENWTGDKTVSGPDLAMRMFEHAKEFGGTYKYGDVVDIITKSEQEHIIKLSSGDEIEARAVIIATGMNEKVPTFVENVQKFENRGVSYCAICDGPLYKGKRMAVLGGGDSAIKEAQFLAQFASEVLIVARRNVLRAEKKLVDDLKAKENVKFLLETTVKGVYGEEGVENMIVVDKDGNEETIKIAAFFPYIGHTPGTAFVKHLNITDEHGFIETDENMETKIKGVFATGDVRVKEVRQIATAVSDGAIAGKIITNRL